MQEEFLHYLWVNKKLPFTQLKTHLNEKLEINHFGQYLQNAGPEFLMLKFLLISKNGLEILKFTLNLPIGIYTITRKMLIMTT
jgi:hypothetical protein